MKRKIDVDTIEEEFEENPYLKGQLINKEAVEYNRYNLAQKLNSLEWYNKYGRLETLQTSNTYLAKQLSQRKALNFGAIDDYNIDTLPTSLFKCKGTEVTRVESLSFKNKHLINRRFLSNVLSTWSYLLGIGYIEKAHPYYKTGTKLWCKELEYESMGEIKTTLFITGNQIKQMLIDIIFLSRDKSPEKIKEYMKNGKISEQFYDIILYKSQSGKEKFEDILQDIKDRVFYEQQIGHNIWNYPKYNIEYLNRILLELNDKNYYMDILIPIIEDLYKYPIICKDTHVFPLSDKQHDKAKDDYDFTQYIWEDR